jgi:hypothetical protein
LVVAITAYFVSATVTFGAVGAWSTKEGVVESRMNDKMNGDMLYVLIGVSFANIVFFHKLSLL